ncbi:MAG: DUF4956 domain-containing protein [Ruminococcus sp.]|nr:DUF4956 domain-containing protein [Ruminococcus sp.]
MENIFKSVLSTDTLTLPQVVICTISAVVLGFLICMIYMFTHKKIGYAQSYVLTMVMLPAIIAIIIMLVGNNMAKAFSLAGAFSLIRFRSDSGDPADISYIFFSVAVGLACGMGFVAFGFVFLIILGVIMILLNHFKFGAPAVTYMTLKITIPEDLSYQGVFDNILNTFTSYWNLRRVKTTEFGSLFELIYDINLNNDTDQKKFIDYIRTLNGNLNVTLVLARNSDRF